MKTPSVVIVLLALLVPSRLTAQIELPPLDGLGFPENAQVLLLGTYHFANPGLDAANVEADDVRTPKRQAEIEALTQTLLQFKPTVIVVEVPANQQARIDSLYDVYSTGDYLLPRNEAYQLGFRLSMKAGIGAPRAVDVQLDLPFNRLPQVAAASGTMPLVQQVLAVGQQVANAGSAYLQDHSIGAYLRTMNTQTFIVGTHAAYLALLPVGTNEDPVGADIATKWYTRNQAIYRNILDAMTGKNDRVLVIFGAGHGYWLQTLFEATPGVEVVSVLDYLPTE